MVFGTSQEFPTASMDVTRVWVYIPHTPPKDSTETPRYTLLNGRRLAARKARTQFP